ncbi:MAG: magnesium transporter CorA family protein [bacterium]|nr:magnesium transporter CorA family protein [bacterium]
MSVQTLSYKSYRWLNIENPTAEEIESLKDEFPFHPLNLEDYQTKTQSPMLDLYRYYTLFVLDFPYLSPDGNRVLVDEVDFFLGNDYVVVLHDGKLPFLDEIFRRCQGNKKTLQRFLNKGPHFLFYRLADILIDSCFPILDKLNTKTEQIDKDVLEGSGENILGQISLQRRNVIIFQTMVKPALPIFEKLERGEIERFNSDMQNYWSNLLDHLNKIWERLEDLRELNEGLSATYESLLSYRTNEIIKILTMFSAVMLPLTLIASVYGMNVVGLPGSQHPLIIVLITALMAGVAIVMLIYFKFKKWL